MDEAFILYLAELLLLSFRCVTSLLRFEHY